MKSPQERKNESEKKIQAMGVAVNPHLPMIEGAEEVTLKSFDEICDRAAATLLIIQLAIDSGNGEYDEGFEVMSGILEQFGVKDCLNDKEKRVFDGSYSQQDLVEVAWEYECYWSLVWALGLIDNRELEAADGICDCDKAIHLISECGDMAEFKSKCKLRDKEEILDMLDLFYRYHWACVQKRIRPETPVSGLNEEVVMERRRGLEWLISEEKDWFQISLDT